MSLAAITIAGSLVTNIIMGSAYHMIALRMPLLRQICLINQMKAFFLSMVVQMFIGLLLPRQREWRVLKWGCLAFEILSPYLLIGGLVRFYHHRPFLRPSFQAAFLYSSLILGTLQLLCTQLVQFVASYIAGQQSSPSSSDSPVPPPPPGPGLSPLDYAVPASLDQCVPGGFLPFPESSSYSSDEGSGASSEADLTQGEEDIPRPDSPRSHASGRRDGASSEADLPLNGEDIPRPDSPRSHASGRRDGASSEADLTQGEEDIPRPDSPSSRASSDGEFSAAGAPLVVGPAEAAILPSPQQVCVEVPPFASASPAEEPPADSPSSRASSDGEFSATGAPLVAGPAETAILPSLQQVRVEVPPFASASQAEEPPAATGATYAGGGIAPPARATISPAVSSNQMLFFGREEWQQHIGEIPEEEYFSPPQEMKNALCTPCPFLANTLVSQSHICVFMPKKLKGRPLTLNTLRNCLQDKQFTIMPRRHDELGDALIERPYWFMMTRKVIPDSQGKEYLSVPLKLEPEYGGYRLPNMLEAVVGIVSHFLQTGENFFGMSYTYCGDLNKGAGESVVVGSLGATKAGEMFLDVYPTRRCKPQSVGMVATREFQGDGG